MTDYLQEMLSSSDSNYNKMNIMMKYLLGFERYNKC